MSPHEKHLRDVRDRLREPVAEHGHFVDEVRGVVVRVGPRSHKEYDTESLMSSIPRLAGCVKLAVDSSQLEACVRAGMITETQLERAGARSPS